MKKFKNSVIYLTMALSILVSTPANAQLSKTGPAIPPVEKFVKFIDDIWTSIKEAALEAHCDFVKSEAIRMGLKYNCEHNPKHN